MDQCRREPKTEEIRGIFRGVEGVEAGREKWFKGWICVNWPIIICQPNVRSTEFLPRLISQRSIRKRLWSHKRDDESYKGHSWGASNIGRGRKLSQLRCRRRGMLLKPQHEWVRETPHAYCAVQQDSVRQSAQSTAQYSG